MYSESCETFKFRVHLQGCFLVPSKVPLDGVFVGMVDIFNPFGGQQLDGRLMVPNNTHKTHGRMYSAASKFKLTPLNIYKRMSFEPCVRKSMPANSM